MSLMANPMDTLISFQQALNSGVPIDLDQLDEGYLKMHDIINGGKRYSYVKIVKGEVQALAIFGQENQINSLDCYNVGYAVSAKHRGHGLSIEAVNKGIEELKKEFAVPKMKSFYVDAIIDVTNIHSINVAKKLFPGPGREMIDSSTGTPALYFRRLIVLEIL